MIRSKVSRTDFLAAMKPLLDLIGVEPEAVMAEDFIIGTDSIRFTYVIPNDDGHKKKPIPSGFQEPGGPHWAIASARIEVGIDRSGDGE